MLDYMAKVFRSELRTPTIREIGSHFGYTSTMAVTCFFQALVKKGYLLKRKGTAPPVTFSKKTRDEYGLYFVKEPQEEFETVEEICRNCRMFSSSIIKNQGNCRKLLLSGKADYPTPTKSRGTCGDFEEKFEKD